MGRYSQFRSRGPKSVGDVLSEARSDHFADCPNAPFLLRLTAFVLDWILFLTAASFFMRFLGAMGFLLGQRTFLNYGVITALIYFYFVDSVVRFGGSPGKIMLGLRVVDLASGAELSVIQAFLREIVGKIMGALFLFAGFWIVFITADHRSFHDRISQSVVKLIRWRQP